MKFGFNIGQAVQKVWTTTDTISWVCLFNSYNLMLNIFLFQLSVMYYNLSIVPLFYMHASVILVIFTSVCRRKMSYRTWVICYTYSMLNKVSSLWLR